MDKSLAEILNNKGLDKFAEGELGHAHELIKNSYKKWSDEKSILINLGLCYLQMGDINAAERCYMIALQSEDIRTRRAATKNIGLLNLKKGKWEEGWRFYQRRFEGYDFLKNQWKGEELGKNTLLVWNDIGMGDAFNFIRYTKILKERGEKIIFAVDKSQIRLIKEKLAWYIDDVIDRNLVMPPPKNMFMYR